MAEYVKKLERAGYVVELAACDGEVKKSQDVLQRVLPEDVVVIHVVDLVDDVLGRRLRGFADGRDIRLRVYETPQFVSPPEFLSRYINSGEKPFMARFYQLQRRRMNVLMDERGGPVGGQWSYDVENRKRLPRGLPIPPRPRAKADYEEVAKRLRKEFPEAVGRADSFFYPTTHAGAEEWLRDFLKFRLSGFGTYEDAISARHPVIFHSVLTPLLNIGLLTPGWVIEETLAYAGSHDVPLNALEGFVRQVIGWREYMRLMYESQGREMRVSNFWGFSRRMPRQFYDGTTGIEPVDHVIRQVLATGYCHHIERLMVLGNFMLLCRIHPDDVYRWFMEMFVDSYDWVMVPNVYGMSQYADGGRFTTKPYLSGSNYVLKMSDFEKGPWCEVWDALFWTFVADHKAVFSNNPRMKMMANLCGQLGNKLAAHRAVADRFLAGLS